MTIQGLHLDSGRAGSEPSDPWVVVDTENLARVFVGDWRDYGGKILSFEAPAGTTLSDLRLTGPDADLFELTQDDSVLASSKVIDGNTVEITTFVLSMISDPVGDQWSYTVSTELLENDIVVDGPELNVRFQGYEDKLIELPPEFVPPVTFNPSANRVFLDTDPNFFGILTANSPTLNIDTEFVTKLYDAPGAQNIAVEVGGALQLVGSSGKNNFTLPGSHRDWIVYRDGSYAIFDNGSEQVEIPVTREFQKVRFDDSFIDGSDTYTHRLFIKNVDTEPVIVLAETESSREQIVGLTGANILSSRAVDNDFVPNLSNSRIDHSDIETNIHIDFERYPAYSKSGDQGTEYPFGFNSISYDLRMDRLDPGSENAVSINSTKALVEIGELMFAYRSDNEDSQLSIDLIDNSDSLSDKLLYSFNATADRSGYLDGVFRHSIPNSLSSEFDVIIENFAIDGTVFLDRLVLGDDAGERNGTPSDGQLPPSPPPVDPPVPEEPTEPFEISMINTRGIGGPVVLISDNGLQNLELAPSLSVDSGTAEPLTIDAIANFQGDDGETYSAIFEMPNPRGVSKSGGAIGSPSGYRYFLEMSSVSGLDTPLDPALTELDFTSLTISGSDGSTMTIDRAKILESGNYTAEDIDPAVLRLEEALPIDTTAPEISTIELNSGNSLVVPSGGFHLNNLDLDIKANDDLSGIAQVKVEYSDEFARPYVFYPGENSTHNGYRNYNHSENRYEGFVSEYTQASTLEFDVIRIKDLIGNETVVLREDLTELGYQPDQFDIALVGTTPDVNPPVFEDLEWLNTPDEATGTFSSDPLIARISYDNNSANVIPLESVTLVMRDQSDVLYELTGSGSSFASEQVTIKGEAEQMFFNNAVSELNFEQLTLLDFGGNQTVIARDELEGLGLQVDAFDLDWTYSGSQTDVTAPGLVTITAEHESQISVFSYDDVRNPEESIDITVQTDDANGTGTETVTARYDLGLLGEREFVFDAISADGNVHSLTGLKDVEGLFYAGSTTIEFLELEITDHAGNANRYTEHELIDSTAFNFTEGMMDIDIIHQFDGIDPSTGFIY